MSLMYTNLFLRAVGHLLINVLDICMSSLEKCLPITHL